MRDALCYWESRGSWETEEPDGMARVTSRWLLCAHGPDASLNNSGLCQAWALASQ